MYLLVSAAVFATAYLLNITWISLFYHRALAHRAIVLGPRMRRFVVAVGPWITGMDPKAWVCMHRLHHRHSDTPKDPHSPRNAGILGVLFAQYTAYIAIQRGLAKGDLALIRTVSDLDFEAPRWMYNRATALMPYLVHAAAAAAFAALTGYWLLAAAFWVGMMSHPVQGWLVNAFAHSVGHRNFDLRDDSRNTWLLGVLVAGEGLQNNHHAFPASAKFSFRWWEIDPGWGIARTLDAVGLVDIRTDRLIPTPAAWQAKTAARRRLLQELGPARAAAGELISRLEPLPEAVLAAARETVSELVAP